ncbi:MAG: hypothetical protein A3J28_10460 [Acidobacteria bacterium RIFCSPLOWO2_12_FULL_60_22]|nr:MAG: hypothetical protein A3J28_10460 [Acidobacteria bacterium RIFCSPLOWO2_12_FULL_60_22]
MEHSTTTEGRQRERSLANGEATIHTASGQAAGPLVDVSEGGIQILCPMSGSIGELAEVCFTPEGYPEQIKAQGRVARIQPDRVGIELPQTSSWLATWEKIREFYAPEQRLLERCPAEGEAAIYTASSQATGRLVDVSEGGLKILCRLPVSKGDSVEIRFRPEGYPDEIRAQGRVARSRADSVAVEFTQTKVLHSALRKIVAFWTVKQKKTDAPRTPGEVLERAVAIQREAAQHTDLGVKTKALWKMESLGVTFGRLALDGDTLSDPNLPAEARPILHVGMGGAAVEEANFDPDKIKQRIDSLAHPDYRLFSYEQIGAMLGVYEKTVPRLMLGLKRLNRPDPAQYIPLFPSEVQRLISHGYGRLLYFNSKDIRAALLNIKNRKYLDLRAAVQGMAFGYTMVNHNELGVVLETGDGLIEPTLVKAFKAGLVYALEFWEWASPGFLPSLRLSGSRPAELIQIAREEIESARKRGFLGPFVVERLSGAP